MAVAKLKAKICANPECTRTFSKPPNESYSQFARRLYCGTSCANKVSGLLRRGKRLPESTRKKISAARSGIRFTPSHKRALSKAQYRRFANMSSEERKSLSEKRRLTAIKLYSDPIEGIKIREKISRSLVGRPVSKETRLKISRSESGREASLETRRKISRALKGRVYSASEIRGHNKAEVREKHRAARLRQVFPTRGTKPERLFFSRLVKEQRKRLATFGYYILRQPSLDFCQPDFGLFSSNKPCLFIFIDGCYWHGCSLCFREPSERQKEFIKKDRRQEAILKLYGIPFARFWEHELKTKEMRHCCVDKLVETLDEFQILLRSNQ